MRLRQFRGEDEVAIDMRELKAGLRPVRSTAERILIRSLQLREQLACAAPKPQRSRDA